MTLSTHKEELLSSIASLSPPLSLQSGTLELPYNSDLLNLDIFLTPEPILPDTQPSSSINTHPLSSTRKTDNSPTPPPPILHVTIENVTHTVPSSKKKT